MTIPAWGEKGHDWKARTGRLSNQVLTEFYITVTQKLDPGMGPEQARRSGEEFLEIKVINPFLMSPGSLAK